MGIKHLYPCVICGEAGFTVYRLTRHVRSIHFLSLDDYWWKHVEKLPSRPLCKYLLCEDPDNPGQRKKVEFNKPSVQRYRGTAFRLYCCPEHRIQDYNRSPEMAIIRSNVMIRNWEQTWFAEMREGEGRKQRIAHNKTPKMREVSRQTLRRLQSDSAQFRADHEGRVPREEALHQNTRFRALNPVSQDRRFFHRFDGYILDFSIPQYRIAIELDGDYHDKEKDFIRDKYLLENYGWTTLRFPNYRIDNDLEGVVDDIYKCIEVLEEMFGPTLGE